MVVDVFVVPVIAGIVVGAMGLFIIRVGTKIRKDYIRRRYRK